MGKKISEDEIKWILSVNSSQAQQEIHKLTTANKDLTKSNKDYRDEQTKLIAAGKKESAEYKNLSKTIEENNSKINHNQSLIKELEGTLGLTALTMSQLKKKAKDLAFQLDQTSKESNPQEYKRLEKELTSVRGRMDELKNSSKHVQSAFGSIKSLLPSLGLAAAGAAIASFLNGSTEAAIESEKAIQQLGFAVKNVGGGTDSDLAKMTKQASELMGIFDDEDIMNADAQMINFGLRTDQVLKLMPLMVDAAAASGKSLSEMASAVDKGTESGAGARTALGQLGIIFKDTGDKAENFRLIQEGLTKFTSGNEAAMKSQWGTLQNLKIQWGELKETIGGFLLEALVPTANKFVEFLNLLKSFPAFLKASLPALAALTVGFVSYTISVNASTIATKADVAWKKIQEIWTNRVAIAQKVLNLVVKQNPIAFAISLIAALVAGFVTWYNSSIKVQAVTQGLFASIKVLGKHLLDYWTGLWKIISGAATLDPKKMKAGIDQLKNTFVTLGDDVASAYQDAYNKRMATAEKNTKSKKPKNTPTDEPDLPSGGSNSGKTDPNKKKIEKLDSDLLTDQVAEKKKVQSKEDLDKALLALEEKYLTKKRDLYKKDTAEYNGYESQLVDIALSKQLNANTAQLKIVQDGNKAKQLATDLYERTKRQELLDNLESGLLTQEQFTTSSMALDEAIAQRRLQDANDYAEIIRNATYNSDADKAQAVDAAQAAVDAAKDTLLKSQEAIEKGKQQAKKKKDEDAEKLEKEHLEKVSKLRDDLGLNKEKLNYQQGLDALKLKLKEAEATEKQSADAIARYKISKAQEYAEAANEFVNTVANFVSASNDAQADSLEAAKQKELTAVGNNADAREEIENKYAQKELDLKKKQADANMAIAIAQAIAEGALGIAKIWAVEGVNPIYAGVLTALLVGITAMNIQSAVAQRNAIKSTTLSGSSSSSSSVTASGLEDGGEIDVTRSQDGKRFRNALYDPDRRGYIDRPTVIVGEGPSGASREWVASNDAVANPTIAPILSILDKHQQAGTIRTLDMNQVIRANMAGYASGGSIRKASGVSESGVQNVTKVADSSDTTAILKDLATTIKNLQENGISADVSLTDLERKQNLRNKARRIGTKK